MTEKRPFPLSSEQHAVALERIEGYVPSVADYFTTQRTTSVPNTHRLPQVRIPEVLAKDLSVYGNSRGYTCSQAVRELLVLGLQKAKELQ